MTTPKNFPNLSILINFTQIEMPSTNQCIGDDLMQRVRR
jgi:hypothetical protein